MKIRTVGTNDRQRERQVPAIKPRLRPTEHRRGHPRHHRWPTWNVTARQSTAAGSRSGNSEVRKEGQPVRVRHILLRTWVDFTQARKRTQPSPVRHTSSEGKTCLRHRPKRDISQGLGASFCLQSPPRFGRISQELALYLISFDAHYS